MRKLRKNEIILLISYSYCCLAAIITIPLVERAYTYRGYFSIGGEFIPLLSIPFVLLITAIYYFTQL